MNYLIWKGTHSRVFKGLVICELPPITKPQMRVTETVVDGVDGSVIEEVGYSSYDKTLIIGLTQSADIDQIIKYFTGTGEVVFSNEPNRAYKATIINQIDYARLGRFKTATVVFRVQPFKREYSEVSSRLWLNEYGGKNLFNPNKTNATNGASASYKDSILTLSSTITGTRAGRIYNFDSEQGDTIRISSVLLDRNCHIALQEYDSAFNLVGQMYMIYIDGETPTVAEYVKKSNENRTRIVLYTDFNTPTGERVARYKELILTVNNEDLTFDEYITDNSINSYSVNNVGNYFSKPVMEIKGSGTIELAVNGNNLFRYTFPDGENTVIIDSQKQDAYLGVDLKNRSMSGEFPTFEVGENILSWDGLVTSLNISSKSRWL